MPLALQLETRRLDVTAIFKRRTGLASFKARHGLATRQGTSNGQKLPKDADQKLDILQSTTNCVTCTK